jgi:hypothetical protein
LEGEERAFIDGRGFAHPAHAVAFGEDDLVVLHNRDGETGHFPVLPGFGGVLVDLPEPRLVLRVERRRRGEKDQEQ